MNPSYEKLSGGSPGESASTQGQIYSASAPSNIALVKYWGKRDPANQWPTNDSISLTLKNARSLTQARVMSRGEDSISFLDHVDKKIIDTNGNSQLKPLKHLEYLREKLGFTAHLAITTENTFPTGCGIASSASGMAALTIAALAAWTDSHNLEQLKSRGFSLEKLASLARMGSGSACRSLHGGIVHWQAGDRHENQTVSQLGDWNLSDLIAIADPKAKGTSSSQGHELAWSSPLFKLRLAAINERIAKVKQAIHGKNFELLGQLIEEDALEMHAIMMTSSPSLRYLQPKSLEIAEWVRNLRSNELIPVYFTIDAGPNIHMICEKQHEQSVRDKFLNAFSCKLINDTMGTGPTLSVQCDYAKTSRAERTEAL